MVGIKFCGLTREEDVDHAHRLGIDYIGLVYCQSSPRHLPLQRLAGLIEHTLSLETPRPHIVVLSVNALDDPNLNTLLENHKPDVLQCHGCESVTQMLSMTERHGISLIKSLPLGEPNNDTQQTLATIQTLQNAGVYVLVDRLVTLPSSSGYHGHHALTGGSGEVILDDALEPVVHCLRSQRWFLAGGLTADNVQQKIRRFRPDVVDVSSGIEQQRGKKDHQLMEQFVYCVKEATRSIQNDFQAHTQ